MARPIVPVAPRTRTRRGSGRGDEDGIGFLGGHRTTERRTTMNGAIRQSKRGTKVLIEEAVSPSDVMVGMEHLEPAGQFVPNLTISRSWTRSHLPGCGQRNGEANLRNAVQEGHCRPCLTANGLTFQINQVPGQPDRCGTLPEAPGRSASGRPIGHGARPR